MKPFAIVLGLLLAACPAPPPPTTTTPPTTTATTDPKPPAPPPGDDTKGPICGTRGAAECAPEQFCAFEIGAQCGATDRPGHCAVKPQICPHLVKPVCGCDGKTYNNSCEASRAGTGLAAEGACAAAKP